VVVGVTNTTATTIGARAYFVSPSGGQTTQSLDTTSYTTGNMVHLFPTLGVSDSGAAIAAGGLNHGSGAPRPPPRSSKASLRPAGQPFGAR